MSSVTAGMLRFNTCLLGPEDVENKGVRRLSVEEEEEGNKEDTFAQRCT